MCGADGSVPTVSSASVAILVTVSASCGSDVGPQHGERDRAVHRAGVEVARAQRLASRRDTVDLPIPTARRPR
jgi:hypothetical protein